MIAGFTDKCASCGSSGSVGHEETRPVGLVFTAGSAEANGLYLDVSGVRTAGSTCGAGGDYFGETLNIPPEKLVSCGVLGGTGQVSSDKLLCPGTWSFENVQLYEDASSCGSGAPVFADCGNYTDITVVSGSNTVDLTCTVNGANVTFDITLQSIN